MDQEKFIEMIKKISGGNYERKEPTEDEMLEHEAFAIVNPIQTVLHEGILETLNTFGIDIVYRKNKKDIYVINHDKELATTLDKFLEAYFLLLEDFVISTLKRELKKENKECDITSKLQIKAEARANQIKEIIGEEAFKEMNKLVLQQAEENFKRDMKIKEEVLNAKDKKMC